jgi:hypothetical protein
MRAIVDGFLVTVGIAGILAFIALWIGWIKV